MIYTVDQIMKWYPCYTESRVRKLVGDGLTAKEIASLYIPCTDIRWCLLRFLKDSKGHHGVSEFAINCSRHASFYYAHLRNNAFLSFHAELSSLAASHVIRFPDYDVDFATTAASHAVFASKHDVFDYVGYDNEIIRQINYLVDSIGE